MTENLQENASNVLISAAPQAAAVSTKLHVEEVGLNQVPFQLLGKLRLMRNTLHLTLPPFLRSTILGGIDCLAKPKNQLIPPLKFRHTIGQTQEYDGAAYVQSLRDLCNLQPYEKVLDVGCGCGRIALSLAKYIDERGSYEGFDIIKGFVDWCQTTISPRYPNFNFTHANVYNSSYNPNGNCKALDFKFPYKDGSFDVVVLSSVFSHMLPQDMANYFREIARVLKVGGRCWISYFLVDGEAQRFTIADNSKVHFIDMDGYFIADPKIPENAVGYQEENLLEYYEENNLDVQYPIHYSAGNQNLIVAKKKPSSK
jgi:SAM-dependent methyltransferase